MMGQASKPARAAIALAAALLVQGMVPTPGWAQSTPAPATATPAPAPPATPGKLTGVAAWQVLVGNTAVVRSRDGGYTEYYAPDGTVHHLDRDGRATGKWTIQGEKVCFDFADEDDHSCVQVEVMGQKGDFIDEDTARDTFNVLTGNAMGL